MANKWNLKAMMTLTSAQFNKLNIATKMEIVKKLEKIGNKRIEALKKSGLSAVSHAFHSRSAKKFNTRMPLKPENVRKSRKASLEKRLLKGFGQAKLFLGAKSSTIKGAQKIFNRASKDFGNVKDLQNATKEQLNKFWTAYNNLRDIRPTDFRHETSDTRLQELWKIMVTPLKKGGFRFKSVDSAVNAMLRELDDEYKKAQDELAKTASDYFKEVN